MEAAIAALEDMFRDTSDKPNSLQMKAEQAYGTLAAWKMVDEHVRPSPSLSCFAYQLQPARSAFMSSCSALMPALSIGSGASARAGCDSNQGCHADVFGRTDGRSDDSRGGVRDLDAL
jgi:hypothetical protein